MPHIEEAYLASSLSRVWTHLIGRDFTITTQDLRHTISATFNGPTITLNEKLDNEARLYCLLHIFGHTVQWSLDHTQDPSQRALTEASRSTLRAEEKEATEYGLGLLHSLGIIELDQWVSDLWHWDWRYMEAVHLEKRPICPEFNYRNLAISTEQPLLQPRHIPEFTIREFETQVVI